MNLIDENIERETEEKQRKISKIIIIVIIVLILLAVIIVVYSVIKRKNTLTLAADNSNVTFPSDLFLMEDSKLYTAEDGKIYISVKKLANMLQDVGYYNDEYKVKGEDTTKCHIKTENEYTSYLSNSDQIYKVIDNKDIIEARREENKKKQDDNEDSYKEDINELEYEYFSIQNGVKYVNNEIYAKSDAIELGFNVSVSYDAKNKAVSIHTINGLQDIAKKIASDVATDETVSYNNKKLLKYGYVLVKKESDKYGIVNYLDYTPGDYALSCKYSNIKFIEGLGCLIVRTSDENEEGLLKIDLERRWGCENIN